MEQGRIASDLPPSDAVLKPLRGKYADAARPRRGVRAPAATEYFDPDCPSEGWYRVRLRKGAPDSAIYIFLGHGVGPDGEAMTERSPTWQCELNGARVDVFRFWPDCGRDRLPDAEGERISNRNRTMDAGSPFYDPKLPLELNSVPPPF